MLSIKQSQQHLSLSLLFFSLLQMTVSQLEHYYQLQSQYRVIRVRKELENSIHSNSCSFMNINNSNESLATVHELYNQLTNFNY